MFYASGLTSCTTVLSSSTSTTLMLASRNRTMSIPWCSRRSKQWFRSDKENTGIFLNAPWREHVKGLCRCDSDDEVAKVVDSLNNPPKPPTAHLNTWKGGNQLMNATLLVWDCIVSKVQAIKRFYYLNEVINIQSSGQLLDVEVFQAIERERETQPVHLREEWQLQLSQSGLTNLVVEHMRKYLQKPIDQKSIKVWVLVTCAYKVVHEWK